MNYMEPHDRRAAAAWVDAFYMVSQCHDLERRPVDASQAVQAAKAYLKEREALDETAQSRVPSDPILFLAVTGVYIGRFVEGFKKLRDSPQGKYFCVDYLGSIESYSRFFSKNNGHDHLKIEQLEQIVKTVQP